MIYFFTNAGIVAVEGGYAAVSALRNVGAQIADDLAKVGGQIDDAKSLSDFVKNYLNGNGLESLKVFRS